MSKKVSPVTTSYASRNGELENNSPFSFDFEGFDVRVIVDENNNPWFVLSDVCKVLEVGNPSDAARRLDDDEVTLDTIEGSHRPTNIVNESGLYSLILTSRKPAAKRFKKWVTSVVLPEIRKTGSFNTPPQQKAIPTTHAELYDAHILLTQEHLDLLVDHRDLIVEHDQLKEEVQTVYLPKVEVYDSVMNSGGTIDFQQLADHLGIKGMGRNNLYKLMRDRGILMSKQSRRNLPYRQYIEQGYFVTKLVRNHVGMNVAQTFITSKGVDWIARNIATWIAEAS